MKKIYHLLFAFVLLSFSSVQADTFFINTSGTSYTPSVVNAVVGDEITIHANLSHPLVEVSESTWNSNGSTMLPSGFGGHITDFTFTVTSAGTIYYVCENHVEQFQMKGLINVSVATGIEDAASIASLKVFPTIVSDGVFNVSSEGDILKGATLELFSTNGQLVKSFTIETEKAVITANVATGTYTAVISVNDKALLRERMIFMAE